MERKLQTLAGRITLARGKRKLSQTALAEKVGLKQSDVSKLENGGMQSTTKMAALCRVLNVPSEWLELGLGPEPVWEASSAGPTLPPSDYHDRLEVTESGWAILQDLADMPSRERDTRIADIRAAAENYRTYLREALGKMKGEPLPAPPGADLYRLPDPVGGPVAPEAKEKKK